MRLLFLTLMLALLPLCGWASSAMPAGHHAVEISAAKNASPHHDCNEHAHDAPEAMASVNVQSSQDLPSLTEIPALVKPCSTCGDCSLCHSLALVSTPHMAVPTPRPFWQRPSQSARFASALSALRLKPPIA